MWKYYAILLDIFGKVRFFLTPFFIKKSVENIGNTTFFVVHTFCCSNKMASCLESLKTKESRRATLIGDYDWGFLCMPRFPFGGKNKQYSQPPFYAHDEKLSLFVALMIGLQHALTMSTNIITPAILVFNVVMSNYPEIYNSTLGEEQALNRERALDIAQYLVSASLICSGLCTMLQVSTVRIPFTNYQIGTGILSTMGTGEFYEHCQVSPNNPLTDSSSQSVQCHLSYHLV